MNVLDIIILLLFLPGIIRGLTKGLIEQAVSLAGIVASVWAAYKYYGAVAIWLDKYIDAPETAVNVMAFLLVLVAGVIVVMIIARILTGIIKMANLHWINRLLGVVLGIAVSAVIISILIILFETVNAKFEITNSPVISESLLYDTLRELGYKVFPYLKEVGNLVHPDSVTV